jgi:hypothetical protein
MRHRARILERIRRKEMPQRRLEVLSAFDFTRSVDSRERGQNPVINKRAVGALRKLAAAEFFQSRESIEVSASLQKFL